MADSYRGEGSLVVVTVAAIGSAYETQHAYAVAEESHGEAQAIVEADLPENESVLAVTTLPARVMEKLSLAPGEYRDWPVKRK